MKSFLESCLCFFVLSIASMSGAILKDLIAGPAKIEVQFVLPPAEIEPQPEPHPCNVPVI